MAIPGLMQRWPMNVTSLLDYAARWHPEQEVVSKTPEGPTVITTYLDVHKRSQLCALALQSLGVREGTLVATLAWNTFRHMESWYGIMGSGAVCHTVNPRLSDKDIRFIVNDAQDYFLLSDITFAQQLERIVPDCPSLKGVVFLTDRQHMPPCSLPCPVYCYEELLDAQLPHLASFSWTPVDEDAACGLCYTSGTTGNPKGVLYSHRSNFLHALVLVQPDNWPMTSSSVCLAIVPMFHANSWGMVFAAPMVGAKLVLPGPWLDGESVCNLMVDFSVTMSAGVPTVWLNLLNHLETTGQRPDKLKVVCIGGSAASRAMIDAFEIKYGIEVRHLWGMTEISPLGTVGGVKAAVARRKREDILANKVKQGRPHALCDMRIVDDTGKVAPHDGKTMGHLQVRGPIVVREYYKAGKPAVDADGWFATGDVCTIDKLGHMSITDRSKDVVKSGGEWISTIEIENLAMGHPAVAEAAVVAIPHKKWDERPLLVAVLKPHVEHEDNHEHIKEELYKHLDGKIAKFAMPDDIVFVSEIPHNATGKVSKLTLREMFKAHTPARSRF